MKYTVTIKEMYDKKGDGVTLVFYTLEDVMNVVALMAEGQKQYHNVEIKITSEPREDLAKDEER